jgi:hypothetical protein
MLERSVIPRAHVLQLARELKRQAIEKRAALDGARAYAWQLYCHYNGRSEGCHSFWRCMPRILDRLAETGRDYTAVRCYDTIATAVAEEYPEWQDQTEALWHWLGEPYERLPRTDDFIREAEEILER